MHWLNALAVVVLIMSGWRAIGKWGGVTFADFLRTVGADTYPGGYWEDQGYNWFGSS